MTVLELIKELYIAGGLEIRSPLTLPPSPPLGLVGPLAAWVKLFWIRSCPGVVMVGKMAI